MHENLQYNFNKNTKHFTGTFESTVFILKLYFAI